MGKSKLTAYGEAVQALREAANLGGIFCSFCEWQVDACDAGVQGGSRELPCPGPLLRAALRAIDEARPSREDAEALYAAYVPLFRDLGIGIAEGAALAGDILDAIDAHLLAAEAVRAEQLDGPNLRLQAPASQKEPAPPQEKA